MVERCQKEVLPSYLVANCHEARFKPITAVGGVFEKERQRVTIGTQQRPQDCDIGVVAAIDGQQNRMPLNPYELWLAVF